MQAWNLSILCSCNLHIMPFFCRYVKARVLVALADGTVAIFHRASGEFKFPSFEFGSCKGHPPTGFVSFEVIRVKALLLLSRDELRDDFK